MKARILLVGKNGQIGHDLQQLLPAVGETIALGREDLDLSRPDSIRRAVQHTQPQLIINAAAYTSVDQAESDESAAYAINALAPAVLAESAKRVGAALIHYSTDYVFDGAKSLPYEENDATNPINAYGRTKLAGEKAIRDSGVAHLIFRTAWVYSTRGKNFLLTIMQLATQREELRIVKDQIGAPTCSRKLAEATARIVSNLPSDARGLAAGDLRELSGTYHMTAAGMTSWAEFAGEILANASDTIQDKIHPAWLAQILRGNPIIAKRIVSITSTEYPTPAKRPAYSVLSNARLENAFGVHLPDWREQLRRAFRSDSSTSL